MDLKKITPYKYLIPKKDSMRVDGIVYANEKIIKDLEGKEPFEQIKNVAELPGIEKYSIGMPDIHWGYGFPIGGVAAFSTDEGIISPGGVGYDINCGVRMIKTNLLYKEVKDKIEMIANLLFRNIPSGVGSGGDIILNKKKIKEVLKKGALWAIENGYGEKEDLDRIEDYGRMDYIDNDSISNRAYERGYDQLGTLGAGNHFLEIQFIEKIYNNKLADKLYIYENMIVIMFHTGSRGLGYQVCDDYIKLFRNRMDKYGISVSDKQLVSVPFKSEEGLQYYNAMKGAANFAWANRQIITHKIRKTFENVFNKSYKSLGMQILYDVSHNIAREEKHEIYGKVRKVIVHRKGATRSLPEGHELLSDDFKNIGQPVLVPGDMGRHSFILVGIKGAKEAFYSTAHGAGRLLSRRAALKKGKSKDLIKDLEKKGIIVKVKDKKLLAEEAPFAYKDAEDITEIVEKANLAKRVARLKPIAVIKG